MESDTIAEYELLQRAPNGTYANIGHELGIDLVFRGPHNILASTLPCGFRTTYVPRKNLADLEYGKRRTTDWTDTEVTVYVNRESSPLTMILEGDRHSAGRIRARFLEELGDLL